MKLGFLFPGQGAQYVGMGKAFVEAYPIAKQSIEQADEALGFSLSRLIFEGPEEELRLTYHTQPALLATSIAAYRVFEQQTSVKAMVACGHSLGEYTALVAAGAMDYIDAVKLVHLRGQYMDDAVPAGQGAMAAVMGIDEVELGDVCRMASNNGEIVELANLNCPGQIVISGTASGVQEAGELAKSRGARRVIPLVVSGPFHCSLMKKAADQLNAALAQMEIQTANIPVCANVDSAFNTSPAAIRNALERQLYSSVRFQSGVEAMLAAGVDTFIEFGPGTVLSGLVKKVDRKISTFHVEDETSLQEVLAAVAN